MIAASIRFDLYHAVLDAMAAAGCAPMKPEAVVFDGRLHRYDVAGRPARPPERLVRAA